MGDPGLIAPMEESGNHRKTDKQAHNNRRWIPEPKYAIHCR